MTKYEAATNMVQLVESFPDKFDYDTVGESNRTTYTIRHRASNIQLVFFKEDTRHGDVFTRSVDSSFNYVSADAMEQAAMLADAYILAAGERQDINKDNEVIEILRQHLPL